MKQRTRILIYILAAIAIVIIGTIVILTNHNTSTPVSAQEKIDLGRMYLLELSYDKAVIEFTEAIEIEPMNADAYLGLAEAYEGMGDIDKAIEILELGYDKTGDARIKDKLDELLPPEPEETTVTTTVATTTEATTVSTMPDLSGLTKEEAISMCEDIGLLYEIKTSESDSIEKDYVISQSVPAGGSVPVNFGITINISEGMTVVTTIETTNVTTTPAPVEEFITIKGVQYSTSLKSLDLTGMDLTNEDIKPLKKMVNLTYLKLERNKISDISVLKNLTNLETLHLGRNQIECDDDDIDALSRLKKLNYLDMYDNHISDISRFNKLTNVKKLQLYRNQISDISALKKLTKLERLDLGENQISDISPLKGLTNLTHLSLRANEISDISTLSGITNLISLELDNNLISDISAISGLEKLGHLTLFYTRISNEDIEELKKALPECDIWYH